MTVKRRMIIHHFIILVFMTVDLVNYFVQMHIIYQCIFDDDDDNDEKMKTQLNLKLTENVLFNTLFLCDTHQSRYVVSD